MKILFVTTEAVPFAKTGGLADVAGAVPKCLRALGHDVALIMPYHRVTREEFAAQMENTGIRFLVPVGAETVEAALLRTTLPGSDVPIYFVQNDPYFDREQLYGTPAGDYPDNADRFIFFCRAILQGTKALNWAPDIYHGNDWQTALLPVYLKTLCLRDPFYHNSRSLLTIHNLAFQGVFPREKYELTGLEWSHFSWQELEFYGKLNLLKGGLVFADRLSAVSPTYAAEIQTPEYGAGLEGILAQRAKDLHGIINGIDYAVWNPAVDALIPARYTPQDLSGKAVCKRELQKLSGLPARSVPLLGLISRLDPQKGLDLIAEIMPDLMQLDLQFVLLGTGTKEFNDLFAGFNAAYPEKFKAHVTFNNALAHQIEAGCDIYLMPSRYEPCGLNQLYSLKYGAVPVVRKTGGLADTIVNCTPTGIAKGTSNGFSFESYSSRALFATIRRALKLFADKRTWRRLMLVGMQQDWSWEKSAREYAALYEKARI